MTPFLLGWPGGSFEAALKLAAALLIIYVLVLWISAVVWVYRDVKMRTNDPFSQWVAVILVGFFAIPGLIVYLVIRPQETITDAYERSLEAEAILQELQADATSCQNCRRPIESDYTICPHCRAMLREPCKSCAKPVRVTWIACPYCGVDRTPVRPQRVPQAQPAASTTPLQAPVRQASRAAATAQAPAQPAATGTSRRPPAR